MSPIGGSRRGEPGARGIPAAPPFLVFWGGGWVRGRGGPAVVIYRGGCTYVHIYRQRGAGRGPQHGEEQNKVHLYRLDPALAAGEGVRGGTRRRRGGWHRAGGGCHAKGVRGDTHTTPGCQPRRMVLPPPPPSSRSPRQCGGRFPTAAGIESGGGTGAVGQLPPQASSDSVGWWGEIPPPLLTVAKGRRRERGPRRGGLWSLEKMGRWG